MDAPRLSRLRHQMLLATLSLPGCWTGPTPVAPQAIATPAPTPVVKVDFDPQRCGIDEIVETACGPIDDAFRTCGTRGDRLGQHDQLTLYVSAVSAVREFRYDRATTETYRADEGTDASATSCCYSQCSKLVVAASVTPTPIPPGYHQTRTCIPIPPGGTSAPAADEPRCPANVQLANRMVGYVTGDEATCCYLTQVANRTNYPIRGRAARVDGAPTFASTAATPTWTWGAPIHVHVADLAHDVRRALAATWREAAQMEHASIASFANLALRLLALGAPPELVAATHAAAIDEVAHARAAFAIALAYAGAAIGPGAFPAAAHMSADGSIADLALETFVDGCVGETVAALEADRAADGAGDPVIVAALRAIAVDETRHAQLAWAIVAWCVRTDPAIAARLAATLATLPAPALPPRSAALVAHGVLDAPALARVHADALREIVAPCVSALAV
ncbi:MAG: hypothetical protein NT062_20975 [Proteobacteria bacterium]|nr:hypothetical protein [Pseudomonadota bacterium]